MGNPQISQMTQIMETEKRDTICKATGLSVGLLLNFGSTSLQYRRLILTKSAPSA